MSIHAAGAEPGKVGTDAYEAAKERGLEVVLPADDQLFVDLDTPGDHEHMDRALSLLERFGIEVEAQKVTPSASGDPHKHAYLRVKGMKLTPTERILLQAVLGSDRTRELLSWLRIKRGVTPVTVFFEKPAEEKKPPEGDSDGKATDPDDWDWGNL